MKADRWSGPYLLTFLLTELPCVTAHALDHKSATNWQLLLFSRWFTRQRACDEKSRMICVADELRACTVCNITLNYRLQQLARVSVRQTKLPRIKRCLCACRWQNISSMWRRQWKWCELRPVKGGTAYCSKWYARSAVAVFKGWQLRIL